MSVRSPYLVIGAASLVAACSTALTTPSLGAFVVGLDALVSEALTGDAPAADAPARRPHVLRH